MKPRHPLSGHWAGLQAATLQLSLPLLEAKVQEEQTYNFSFSENANGSVQGAPFQCGLEGSLWS